MHTEEWEDIVVADSFRELLKTRDYIIFDGAMGTMLQAAGMKMGETPEVLNIIIQTICSNSQKIYKKEQTYSICSPVIIP